MWGRWVRPLLRSEVSSPCGRFSPALRRGEKRHRVARCLCSLWGGGVGSWCQLGREEGEGASASLQPTPGPGDPAAEPRPERLRREARGPRTRARAPESLSSRLALSLEPRQVSLSTLLCQGRLVLPAPSQVCSLCLERAVTFRGLFNLYCVNSGAYLEPRSFGNLQRTFHFSSIQSLSRVRLLATP